MTERLREIFEENILPEIGRVINKEKYYEILRQLVENTRANGGRGLREAQLTENLRPATHTLNRLHDAGFVSITLPAGDGTLLIDRINNVPFVYNKEDAISSYLDRFQEHVNEETELRQLIKTALNLGTDEAVDAWINSLEDEFDFENFNKVVWTFHREGVNLRARDYGPLEWRKMAKYYNITEEVTSLLTVAEQREEGKNSSAAATA